ncbi:glycosyltransferase family 9 protein [Enterobacter ludwigii]|uniref:glycosyltransferase family 9 protein n=1 Tax=Enterobacter ludwigii TaxID=299767 RepID=UPI0039753D6F
MSRFKAKLLSFIINAYRSKFRTTPENIDFPSVKQIAIINNKRLGDFLFCTPSIRAIKDANPNVKIIAITSHGNKGLISKCPYIDEVLYMGERMGEAIEIGFKLRKIKPDLGIVFHSKSPFDLVAMALSGASCIMKHYFGNERKILMSCYDAVVVGGFNPPVQNDLALVGKLNIDTDKKKMFYPSPVSTKSAEGLNIGIQLGASGSDRFFPTDKAVKIVETVSNEFPSCKFHLIGSRNEVELSTEFFKLLKPELAQRVTDNVGKTTLPELAKLINNFTVLVTPDTGCLHIATALQTKTVSLFTIKQQKASVPQQDPELHHVFYASEYCVDEAKCNLSSIPTEEIIAKVIKAIGY